MKEGFMKNVMADNAKKCVNAGQKGFTLIEVVAVLVLASIIAVFAGMAIVSGIEGYVFARSTTRLIEKGELAMARLAMEIENIAEINSATVNSLCYTMRRDNESSDSTRCVGLTGGEIRIIEGTVPPAGANGYTLIDHVESLQISYYKDYTRNVVWTAGSDGSDQIYSIKVLVVIEKTDGSGETIEISQIMNPKRNRRYRGPINWNE